MVLMVVAELPGVVVLQQDVGPLGSTREVFVVVAGLVAQRACQGEFPESVQGCGDGLRRGSDSVGLSVLEPLASIRQRRMVFDGGRGGFLPTRGRREPPGCAAWWQR